MSVHSKKLKKFAKNESTTVGPGTYTLPEGDLFKNSRPKWTIRQKTAGKLGRSLEDSPGPASYNTNENFIRTKAPLFTIGSRYRTLNSSVDDSKPTKGIILQ